MFNKMKINKAKLDHLEPLENELTQTATPNQSLPMEEATPNEPTKDTSAESSTASMENEPTHFDDLIGAAPEDIDEEGVPINQGMIDVQAFHALFCVSFNTASAVTKLKSLSVDAADEACINCTRALYETIADVPMLRFMLMPNGKWMERAVAIGMFTVPMAMGVSNELAARNVKAETEQSKENPQPSATQSFKSMKEMASEQGIS